MGMEDKPTSPMRSIISSDSLPTMIWEGSGRALN